MKKMFRKIVLSFTFFMISTQVAFAAETEQPLPDTSLKWQFFKLIFFLMLILTMIFFLLRFIGQKNGMVRTNVFQFIGGFPLGQNKSIQMVEIGKKIYVLGVGQEVQLLQVIDNEEELQDIKDSISFTNSTNDRFVEWAQKLKKVSYFQRFFKNTDTTESKNSSDFETLLNLKMTQLKEQRAQSLQQILETSSDTSLENIGKRDSNE